MRYLVIICTLALLAGCKSAEKAAEKRAQKERDYLRELQGKYGPDAPPTPPLLVPGGMVVVKQQTPCPDFDSGAVKSKGGQLTVEAPCPDKEINQDSLIRNSDLFKSAIAGRRLAEMKQDSTAKALAVSNADNTRLAKSRDTWRWIAIVCVLMIGATVFSKIKGFI